MTATPLMDRIKEAEQRRRADLRYLRPSEPTPFVAPWRRWLVAKDTTDLVLGSWIGPNERGAA